jgi:hypothetical protein
LLTDSASPDANVSGPWRPVDEAKIAAAGIRKLAGEHLVLYTDLPPGAAIDALPAAFDAALPQWRDYFGIDAERTATWKIRGSLMGERERFERCGLLPAALPEFRNGYASGGELWFYEQSSDYYRRHLLLHEGTHAFMAEFLGGCGPPWYSEGMAELLATHAYRDGELRLNQFPRTREEVPMLGRIKIVQDGFAARKALQLPRVLMYGPRAHLEVEPYGWCWAAAAFLDGHPRYRVRFRQLPRLVHEPDFNARFQHLYADDWAALNEEWQLFVAGLEHNHSLRRTAVDFTPGRPLATSARLRVAADQGWQNSGVALESGVTYALRAAGRYQLADSPQTWWSEPGGVTIRYYQGRPLGILLAAVHPADTPVGGVSPLLRPTAIGLEGELTPQESGTLFLRVNDSAGELADNAGELLVTVSRK